MGTIDTLQFPTETKRAPWGRAVKSKSIQRPEGSLAVQGGPSVVQAPLYSRVHISSSTDLSVHGLLRSVSRGGVQIVTPIPVPIRSPLQVAIAGCQPTRGEALYCMRRGTVYRAGIVFSSRHKTSLEIGAVAKIHSLDPPFSAGCGSVVETGRSSLSIFGKATIVPGSWVRIESNGWILFGVVKDLVATSVIGRYLEIHLEAAFPADLTSLAVANQEPPAFTPGKSIPEKEVQV